MRTKRGRHTLRRRYGRAKSPYAIGRGRYQCPLGRTGDLPIDRERSAHKSIGYGLNFDVEVKEWPTRDAMAKVIRDPRSGDEALDFAGLDTIRLAQAWRGLLGMYRLRRRYGRANPRPKSHGFIVVNTRTGEILSELYKRRDDARQTLDALTQKHGSREPQPGYVEYRNGYWYLPLGTHQVMLYPGETYSRETYKP